MNIPSKILQQAVEQISSLPGIGQKTALRMSLSLLKRDKEEIERFATAINRLKSDLKTCKVCHNLTDLEVCEICANPKRDRTILCVVEDIRDVMAIESTVQFHGLYHVLGGIISPMDGIGPGDLTIDSLIDRIDQSKIKEVILALSTTMEGDTTAFYLSRRLTPFDIRLTTIARGVSFGDELEYIDELTLGRSIQNRLPYNQAISSNS